MQRSQTAHLALSARAAQNVLPEVVTGRTGDWAESRRWGARLGSAFPWFTMAVIHPNSTSGLEPSSLSSEMLPVCCTWGDLMRMIASKGRSHLTKFKSPECDYQHW